MFLSFQCFAFTDVYSYLPFLYSCVSFLGVGMLLICTPLGFARLFSIVGDLVIRPNLMRNLDEDYFTVKFEEDCLRQKLADCSRTEFQRRKNRVDVNGSSNGGLHVRNLSNGSNGGSSSSPIPPSQLAYYERSLEELTTRRRALDCARRTPLWRRILGYPLVLLVLTALTAASLLCVVLNVGQVMAGFRSLPGKQVCALNKL